MDVTEATLRAILEGSKQYRVPLYQRPYAWKQSNWRKLWDDITDLAEERKTSPEASHFTGTLVLDTGSVTTDLTQFLVVDGQQRLTTLSVLLAAIANEWASRGDENAAKRIREQVLINTYAESTDSRYRLRPANFDETIFRSAVEGKLERSATSFVDDAYQFFEKKLKALETGDFSLTEIENAVLKGLKFVTITAKQDDNVYRIFESINNTGVDLTQADLIRNLVFMRLGSDGERIHDTTWMAIQRDLPAEDIENLFWIDAQWRNADVRKLDTYEVQKKHIVGLSTEDLVAYLDNALKIADALRAVRQISKERNTDVAVRLKRIHGLAFPGTVVLSTRIVYLRDTQVISDIEAANALLILESYLVRRVLAMLPVSNLGAICAIAANSLGADASDELHRVLSTGRRQYQRDAVIREKAVSDPVYTQGRGRQLTLILQWLIEGEQGRDTVDFTSMTIEHVLPQKLSSATRKEFAALVTAGDDVDQIHESLVHTLGNLTLTNYNSELSNKPFSVKRQQRLTETAVLANKRIAENQHWGPSEIRNRSNALADLVCEIWPGPNEALLEIEPLSVGDRIDEVIAAIPPGRWSSYGDIANVVGTASQVVGNQVMKTSQDGAWRVLRGNGEIAPGFAWQKDSIHLGKQPFDVLQSEGIEFDSRGYAHPDYRMGPEELQERVGGQLESD